MKIYTRTGDAGETGLFGGGRVPKDHVRVQAYGDVDELNSAIGVARATVPNQLFDEQLEAIQRDLFALGGQLATPDPVKVQGALEKAELTEARVAKFESIMDEAERELPELRAFVLPAGTPKAAALHLARTVCRRAERSVVSLAHQSELPDLFVRYLNRLSDLLFTLARLANHREGKGDVTW
jgi:cob(I)alamin adenosyltransferase